MIRLAQVKTKNNNSRNTTKNRQNEKKKQKVIKNSIFEKVENFSQNDPGRLKMYERCLNGSIKHGERLKSKLKSGGCILEALQS